MPKVSNQKFNDNIKEVCKLAGFNEEVTTTKYKGSERIIEVKPFYSASIPKDRKGEAFEWLRIHGYDDIIKNQVSVQFGRGESDAG